MKMPRTPFSTRLSGSAKETELRIRNIFQWKKKRPPFIALVAAVLVITLCGSLVGFRTTAPEEPPVDDVVVENTPSENDPMQENAADTSAVQTEPVHDWAGTGYLYYSAALEASIEFPPEWASLLHVYDYENTVRIDTLTGWDDTAPDNGRMATIYKFTREDWDTKSGAYRKGMFEGGPTVQIIAEDETYVYVLKRYGGLLGFATLNDPGFSEYKMIDEALKNYELEIYVNDSSDFALPDVIELSTSDGKTYPAQRYDGDGWYIYIPEGWYKENTWDQWDSQYGTGAYLDIQHCSDRMQDIKAYYGVLGAWPYDTDMESPYDYYYLLTPSARDTLRQELFFVPVSETSSYALTCTWVKASQRDGEYDLLHAMAASFAVDERVTRAPAAEDSLAVQDVLKKLTWDNTVTLTREDGNDIYEMSQTGELFELLRSASDTLHPIDQPDEFSTLSGGVFLKLSDDSNGHISFFAGENHPSVLVRYVTDTANEAAIAEDFALYTFLLASSEHKYLELLDLGDDTIFETVVWSNEDNKRNIVIYDYYYSEPQRISVNEALGCTASEYTGQIANIKNEYSNLILAVFADESLLYKYDNGQFTYVCTLDEALRS